MRLAERLNRISLGLAAYRVAFNEGVDFKTIDHVKYTKKDTKGNQAAAIEFANKIIYDAHFPYGKHNLPSGMRGGTVRKIIRSGYTFRTFSHYYLNTVANLLFQQGWAPRVAIAHSLRNIILVGGLRSFPFFAALTSLAYWLLDKDDEDVITDIRAGLPKDWMKDIVTYGLPGVAGIDMSGSISIEIPRNMKDIVGVPYSVGEDSFNAYKSWQSGQKFRAMSELPITPQVLRNAARGLDLYVYGQTTRGGKAITKPTETKPRKLSGARAIQRGVFGFQPTQLSKGYAAYQASGKPLKKLTKKKRYFADRYTNALRKGDGSEKIVEKELREYNQKMKEMGKLYMMVDPSAMIESRFKPGIQNIPKNLRGKTIETYQQWQ
jgi:hypothetical protein